MLGGRAACAVAAPRPGWQPAAAFVSTWRAYALDMDSRVHRQRRARVWAGVGSKPELHRRRVHGQLQKCTTCGQRVCQLQVWTGLQTCRVQGKPGLRVVPWQELRTLPPCPTCAVPHRGARKRRQLPRCNEPAGWASAATESCHKPTHSRPSCLPSNADIRPDQPHLPCLTWPRHPMLAPIMIKPLNNTKPSICLTPPVNL